MAIWEKFRPGNRLPARAAALALILVLAGCAVIEETVMGKALPCPSIKILPEAETITRFKEGPGRDLIDVDFNGKIINIRRSERCDYDIDEDTGAGTLSLELEVVLVLERGPANRSREIGFEYLISIQDPENRVLKVKTFDVKVTFPGNLTVLKWSEEYDEPIILTIPFKAGQRGQDFVIKAGFQLSREEFQYNRRQNRTNL
jgi:hypothetical protein